MAAEETAKRLARILMNAQENAFEPEKVWPVNIPEWDGAKVRFVGAGGAKDYTLRYRAVLPRPLGRRELARKSRKNRNV